MRLGGANIDLESFIAFLRFNPVNMGYHSHMHGNSEKEIMVPDKN